MTRPDHLVFKITDHLKVRADLQRNRVVISCVTEDGKSLELETNYRTLDRIHQEIQKQFAE